MCNFAEITEDTEGNQEDFTNAKEEAIDEEKAVQESEVRSWLRPEAGLHPHLDMPIDYCVLCEICFQRRSKFIRHVKTQIQEGIYKLSKLFSVLIIAFCAEVEENYSNDTCNGCFHHQIERILPRYIY